MLFLTIVFLTFSLVSLVKGKLLYNITIDMAEESISKQIDPNYTPNKELAPRVVSFIIYSFVYLITYIIYLNIAVGIDPIKYPTIFMIVWFIATVIYAYTKGNKKNDFSNKVILSKYRKKIYRKRTLHGFVGNLVTLTYFCYMIYNLVQ